MFVSLGDKFSVKQKNVWHQIILKLLDIFPATLSAYKFFPRLEQIFDRDDIMVRMLELNPSHINEVTPPPARILPVLGKVKDTYLLWHSYDKNLPKSQKHSFGYRIESLFIEIIEAVAAAGFLSPEEKRPYVRFAMKKVDALKILVLILWESKSLDDKKYIALSLKLDEIGRNLGGWNGQLTKQNSPELTKKAGEK